MIHPAAFQAKAFFNLARGVVANVARFAGLVRRARLELAYLSVAYAEAVRDRLQTAYLLDDLQ